MISLVFGLDQIRAACMVLNNPVVMATNQGSQVLIHFRIHQNFFLTVLNTYAKFYSFC